MVEIMAVAVREEEGRVQMRAAQAHPVLSSLKNFINR
jgi:hypothetical protein